MDEHRRGHLPGPCAAPGHKHLRVLGPGPTAALGELRRPLPPRLARRRCRRTELLGSSCLASGKRLDATRSPSPRRGGLPAKLWLVGVRAGGEAEGAEVVSISLGCGLTSTTDTLNDFNILTSVLTRQRAPSRVVSVLSDPEPQEFAR